MISHSFFSLHSFIAFMTSNPFWVESVQGWLMILLCFFFVQWGLFWGGNCSRCDEARKNSIGFRRWKILLENREIETIWRLKDTKNDHSKSYETIGVFSTICLLFQLPVKKPQNWRQWRLNGDYSSMKFRNCQNFLFLYEEKFA
jgi:hypothetical protein